MVKEGHLPVSIPVHNKDLKIGTEQKILKDLELN
ncbi:type II toxin-antitoxin system HicA family toxin [Enterococcus hulanensis]